MEIKGWLRAALEGLRRAGAEYADARFLDCATESITVRNEQVAALSRDRDRGFGIRVLYRGSWGFAASAELAEPEVEAIAERALEIAKASRLTQRRPVRLDDSPPYVDTYRTEFELDPFIVPLDKKLELLFSALKVLRRDPAGPAGRGDDTVLQDLQALPEQRWGRDRSRVPRERGWNPSDRDPGWRGPTPFLSQQLRGELRPPGAMSSSSH
jgi:hypothetical protein